MAYSMMSESPYNFVFGNPVTFNDPLGDRPREVMLDLERNGGGGGGPAMYDWSDNWNEGFGPHQYGQHFMGSGSGNHWSDGDRAGFGMGAGDFINNALHSENGGSWNNGSYHYYTVNEAREVASSYYFENYSYLDYSTANSTTAPTVVLGQRLVAGPGDPSYKEPNLLQSYWNKFKDVYGLNDLPNVGVVIIGRGNEQFSLKPLKDGIIGVWRVGDSKSVMSILDFRTASTVWDTGMGALGVYNEDPRNDWSGSFFDRLYQWNPVPGNSSLYFNVGDPRLQEYYYEYQYDNRLGKHLMTPTTIKIGQ
jgi:hypothetical protein